MSNPVFRILCSSSSLEYTRVTENPGLPWKWSLNALDALEPSSNRAMDFVSRFMRNEQYPIEKQTDK